MYMIRITLKKNRNIVCPARTLTNQFASSVHGCSLGLTQYIHIHRLLCLLPHELNQTNVTIRTNLKLRVCSMSDLVYCEVHLQGEKENAW